MMELQIADEASAQMPMIKTDENGAIVGGTTSQSSGVKEEPVDQGLFATMTNLGPLHSEQTELHRAVILSTADTRFPPCPDTFVINVGEPCPQATMSAISDMHRLIDASIESYDRHLNSFYRNNQSAL